MAKVVKAIAVVEEKIIKKIVFLRNEKIILDVHLAELYGVEIRILKQAVRRNIDRFPGDFMFELTDDHRNSGITKCDTTQKVFRRSSTFCIYRNRRSNVIKRFKKQISH